MKTVDLPTFRNLLSLSRQQSLCLQVLTVSVCSIFRRWWLCHPGLNSCWECCSPFHWAPSGSLRLVPTMESSRCHLKFLLRYHRKFHNTSRWASKYLTCLWAKMAFPWARRFLTCSMAKSTHTYPSIWRKSSLCQEWARRWYPRKAKVTSYYTASK